MAYVFYDRIEHIAQTYLNPSHKPGTDDMYTVIVLAHAMAHEIGHLLLPSADHAVLGLMRASWDAEAFLSAARGDLRFLPGEAASIRAQITR